MRTITIIGSGASGLACAISAAVRAKHEKLSVRIEVLESDARACRSILQTGNGRCNFSNLEIRPELYSNGDFADDVLEGAAKVAEAQFVQKGTSELAKANPSISFLEYLGLEWREAVAGMLFPATNKASTVRDVLLGACDVLGVGIRLDAKAARVDVPNGERNLFSIQLGNREVLHSDAVVISCGGSATDQLLGSEFPFRKKRPVLCPIATVGDVAARLQNIRVKCKASLLREGNVISNEAGEVLFRKYGISGIAAFNLSREAKQGDVVSLDLLYGIDCDLKLRHKRMMALYGHAITWSQLLRGLVLPEVAEAAMSMSNLSADGVVEPDELSSLEDVLHGFKIPVEGLAEPERAQVMRGGYDVSQWDPGTLESRSCDRLYATGEALDVDGPCGGYNLHFAWCSGIVAGHSLAGSLADEASR